MDFSKAVKGSQTSKTMLNSINSRAKIELGRDLLKEETSDLMKKYSLQYVFHSTEKVTISNFTSILTFLFSLVWIWIFEVLTLHVKEYQPQM